MQGKNSNYDTDVFQPLIKEIGRLSGCHYGDDEKKDIAMRVIADHVRAISFSIADGQLPGNAKAGYVIRRILRRAVRYGYTFLGFQDAFMYKLLPTLIDDMGEAYPELEAQKVLISRVMKEEEEAFLRTLSTGMNLLDGVITDTRKHGKQIISGKEAFTLFDTFGFPLDLTELICSEQDMSVDVVAFDAEMKKQKERARNAAAVETGDWNTLQHGETQFIGWDKTETTCHILRYRKITQKKNSFYELVLDVTPFYAEMGGQVGDTGVLTNAEETIKIIDTKRENNLPIHICETLPQKPTAAFTARINVEKRHASEANHTATHLLDQALREVLGTHVEQKGSLVTPDYLRFDFSHFQKVTSEELRQVEKIVNSHIREDLPLQEHRDMPIEEAKKLGAIALFGEKYGDRVRVVTFGQSTELCGGCHAASTGRIGLFHIQSESSVAAGVRRIEAVTGKVAEDNCYVMQDMITSLRELMNSAKDLPAAVKKVLEDNTELKKQVAAYIKEQTDQMEKTLLKTAQLVNGVKVIKSLMQMPAESVKDLVFKLANDTQDSLLCVIGSTSNGKPLLTVMLSKDLVNEHHLNAGQLVREAAKLIQGGGGGAPHFATAGGRNADGLKAAINKVVELANL
jgi:alanyl-tRNA synthetase